MEQGVRKVHGRSTPALKHSRVCEEEQGMPWQSTRSGSPSLEGSHARRQQGLHRQDQHSSTQGVHAMDPSCQAQGPRCTKSPSCSLGKLWGGTPSLQPLTQQGKAWQRHGNVPGVQGEAVEGCVRGGGNLLSYPHFSLPEPHGQAHCVQESLLHLV